LKPGRKGVNLKGLKKIGVLTSGGDCPGMNAAVRAVVRTAIYHNLEIVGIKRGFAGLIKGEIEKMGLGSVSGIINLGGTILKTARSGGFMEEEGQGKALGMLKRFKIEGLIVIGGNGSLRGAEVLDKKWNVPTVGIPASIDNDIEGTDFSIGFDTAINTALEAIDKIRDTATSHERLFLIEVMGRNSGFIALYAGLAGGAEDVLIPETKTNLEKMCQRLITGKKRGKISSIVVVAEGDEAGGAFKIAEKIKEKTGYGLRTIVLGHLQRGGSPTALDRILASRVGSAAVELLLEGRHGKMVGLVGNKIKIGDFASILKEKKHPDLDLYKLLEILAI
jgi:6-phosphofructokinase 1